MCLFALGQGRRVSYIYAVTLAANAILDWLFVDQMQLGFAGAYIATVFVSSIELCWLLGLLRYEMRVFPFAGFGGT